MIHVFTPPPPTLILSSIFFPKLPRPCCFHFCCTLRKNTHKRGDKHPYTDRCTENTAKCCVESNPLVTSRSTSERLGVPLGGELTFTRAGLLAEGLHGREGEPVVPLRHSWAFGRHLRWKYSPAVRAATRTRHSPYHTIHLRGINTRARHGAATGARDGLSTTPALTRATPNF